MRDVGNVRKVVGQHEAAASFKVDGAAAMLEADVADEENDSAVKGT